MEIRPANPGDRPAIIELLKKSLGESTIPKSERLWSWKHEENPFGPSYVLIAEENNTLIGLRAFMRWKWLWKDQIYQAVRAVDTATHPDHQGKGIFKKLTLQQLDICKEEGIHFVFNTPNDQSRPGYLKMGWVQQGKMPLKIKVLKPFSLVYNKLFHQKQLDLSRDPSPVQEWTTGLHELLQNISLKSGSLTTAITPDYIFWRYANNPLFRYNYLTDNKNYVLISRIKDQSVSKELRIVDLVILNPACSAREVNDQIRDEVRHFCRKNNIEFISVSGRQYELNKDFFRWMGILPVRPLGPIITLKNLNLEDTFPSLMDVKNWDYRLGDFELF